MQSSRDLRLPEREESDVKAVMTCKSLYPEAARELPLQSIQSLPAYCCVKAVKAEALAIIMCPC